MAHEDTFSFAFELAKQVMVHATGHPAKVMAVGVAASVVFVAACIGCGIKQAMPGRDE